MLENMLNRVYSQQIIKTEATIRKRLDKIGECPPVANEISGLNNNEANLILHDFLNMSMEGRHIALTKYDIIDRLDIYKNNLSTALSKANLIENALELLSEKNILLKSADEEKTCYCLNYNYMFQHKIWDIVE